MSDFPIDNATYRILDYLYDKKECTVQQLADFCQVEKIDDYVHLIAPIFSLFDSKYAAICNPKLNVMYSLSFDSYKNACLGNSISLITPDCIVCILPKGSALIEERQRQDEKFQESVAPIKSIAEAAEKSAKSSDELAKLSKEEADNAVKDSSFSRKMSIASLTVSIVAIFVSIGIAVFTALS